ncbi:hypothetical protein [Gilvimarinus algae]|uniref:Uncharacterized protein n=1 Tax=Gilvimarinus algae TaxID=3058037 RepID=A0ABT8TK68_9GAMM|nr:hypothetical protein [Gilvimarinus sp. SDUM040014]MDO3383036.1 hypothetical protein [Gilvimarinus sp. SDUM040014]
MKSFILIYNGGAEEREKLIKIIDDMPEIYTWRYDMISCIYLLSNHTAQEIYHSLKNRYPSIGRHIITQFGNDYWGELTGESWHFLEKCEHAPESNK